MPDVHQHPSMARSTRIDVVLLCALVVACGAVLGGFAWSRPATVASATTYSQTGSLSYRAAGATTSVYGPGGVVTGEPIYLSKVTAVDLTYTYRFSAGEPVRLAGTERLAVQVSGGGGLVRTVPVQPVTHFTGSGFSTRQVLPLSTIRGIVSAFEAVGPAGGSYTVSVVPQVTVDGTVDGAAVASSFHQPATFALDGTSLVPDAHPSTAGAGTAATTATAPVAGRALTATSTGTVTGGAGHAATLLPGLGVAEARILALVLLVVGLAGAVLFGLPLLRDATSTDERARIAARFGSSLVAVDALPASLSLAVVEVSSFDGLEQVGRRLECPVLHLRSATGDQYAVVDNGTVYRYQAATAAPGPAAPRPLATRRLRPGRGWPAAG